MRRSGAHLFGRTLEVIEDAAGLCLIGVELSQIPCRYPPLLFLLGAEHGIEEVSLDGEAAHVLGSAISAMPLSELYITSLF